MQTVSKAVDLNLVRWYVMIAFKKEKAAKEDLEAENREREKHKEKKLEFFIPMYFDLKGSEENKKRKKCPLIPNYVFIHASLNEIYVYKQSVGYLKFHRPVTEDGRRNYITVPDRQMQDFMRVALHYEKDICYYAPGEMNLVKGDRVRIIGGEFNGVEGILLCTQGKRGDRVLIEIPGVMSISTCSIAPELIEILSYSSDTRHLYNDLKAFFNTARKALFTVLCGERMSEREEIKLRGFIRRMANMQADTFHTESSLHLILLMAHRALGEDELCTSHLHWCCNALPKLTSDVKRAHMLTYLYGCTGDKDLYRQVRQTTDSWLLEKATAKQKEILDDLQALVGLRIDGIDLC